MRMIMQTIFAIFKREFMGYFQTPVAYIFLVIFLMASGSTTFFLGHFIERNQADLHAFFSFHPWLYLFLVPAVAMRLWSEERKTGTIETLLTLPLTTLQAVLGKFLAAWVFLLVALALTSPIWLTVAFLGDPDHGAIVTSYIGSALMAGSFLAIGSYVSSTTKNQVIAFIVSLAISFIFILIGTPMILDFLAGWAPDILYNTLANFSFMTHFQFLSKGVIDIQSLVFFISVICLFLFANVMTIEWKKAND